MDRIDFAIAGMSTVALAALYGSANAQPPRGPVHFRRGEHDEMFRRCARACSECQHACDACATHCSHELAEGHKSHMITMMVCRDCATICSTAASIVARSGPFAVLICEACIQACANCAVECEKFPGDPHMKACAAECRRCEVACKEMIKHTH